MEEENRSTYRAVVVRKLMHAAWQTASTIRSIAQATAGIVCNHGLPTRGYKGGKDK